MKIKFVLFAIVCLALCSCRTTKTAERSDVKTSSKVDAGMIATDTGTRTAEVVKQAVDKGTINETTEEITRVINYSRPDSAGKQFPVSEAITKKTTTRGENKSFTQEVKSSDKQKKGLRYDEKISAIFTDNTKTANNTTTSVKTPLWVSLSAIVGVIGILIMCYLILRRFNIIK